MGGAGWGLGVGLTAGVIAVLAVPSLAATFGGLTVFVTVVGLLLAFGHWVDPDRPR